MKLYLRHIFNSFKSKPFQPIVIILCIAFSVAIFVSAFVVKDIYYDYTYYRMQIDVGSSDIRMSILPSSETSYMETNCVEKIIGDDGNALGLYQTNAFLYGGPTQKLISACMIDFVNELDTFNSIFKIKFSEHGQLTKYNINESALISKSFADENGINLKDKITIGFGDYKLEYTVEGIMEDSSVPNDINVLISYKGAIKYFKYNVLNVASAFISDDFKPANTILIKFKDGVDFDKYIDLLLQDSHFSDKEVIKSSDSYSADDTITIVSSVLTIIAVAFAVIAILIIYSSLAVLTARRTSENSLFMSIGATKKNMAMLLYLECLIYAIFGSAIGIPTSIGMANLFTKLLDITNFEVTVGWQDILLGLAVGILVPIISASISILKTRSLSLESQLKGELKRYKKPPIWIIIVFLVITIISAICFAFVPIEGYIYLFAVIFITSTIVAILSVPYVTTSISKILNAINNKTNRKGISCIAIKNTSVNIGTQNSSRVFCLIISLLILSLYAYSFATVSVSEIKSCIKGDYAITGISSSDIELCDSITTAESYDFAFVRNNNILPTGISIPLMSSEISTATILNIEGIEEIKAIGNEIYLPIGIAKSCNVKTGDHLNVTINGTDIDFVLAGTFKTKLMFGIIDCSYIGYSNSTALFKIKDGISEEEFINEVQTKFIGKSITIVKTEDFFKGSTNTIEKFLNVVRVLLIFAMLLGTLGCINSFVDSIINRKDEFSRLINMGFTKYDIIRMVSIECVTIFISALLISAVSILIYIFSAQAGLLTFGIYFKF